VGCARAGSDDDVGEEVLLWQVISGGAALTPIIAHNPPSRVLRLLEHLCS